MMCEKPRLRVVLVRDYREASNGVRDFLNLLTEKGLESTVHRTKHDAVIFIDGREVHFVPKYKYHEWCKGRTYWLGDRVYHSGYEVKP